MRVAHVDCGDIKRSRFVCYRRICAAANIGEASTVSQEASSLSLSKVVTVALKSKRNPIKITADKCVETGGCDGTNNGLEA